MKINSQPNSGSIGSFVAKCFALIALGFLNSPAVSESAQTNFTTAPRTNIVAAALNFREVDGQLYNISLSKLWKMQSGKILEVQTNSVLLQTYSTNYVFEPVLVAGPGQPGFVIGHAGHYEQRLLSSNLVLEKQIFINHCRMGFADQEISVAAMQTGTSRINGTLYEVWDCGLPHFVTNVVSSSMAEK